MYQHIVKRRQDFDGVAARHTLHQSHIDIHLRTIFQGDEADFARVQALIHHRAHRLPHGCACFQMQQLFPSKHAMRPLGGIEQIGRVFCGGGCAHIQATGQTCLAQGIDFLHATALAHHQIALHKQLLYRAARWACVPPAAALVLRIFSDVTQAYAAFILCPCQNFAHQGGITAIKIAAIARLHRLHLRQGKAVIAHGQIRCRVIPVFKHLLRRHQLIQMTQIIIGHTTPQHMVVGALHHRNGVNLHIAQMLNRLQTTCHSCSKHRCLPQALLL